MAVRRGPEKITTSSSSLGSLPACVLFTNEAETKSAIQFAAELSKSLDANISVLAVYKVDYRLPVDRPSVSVAFFTNKVLTTVMESGLSAAVQVCLARTVADACLQLLAPDTVVIIGHQTKPFFRLRQSDLAKELQDNGFRVVTSI